MPNRKQFSSNEEYNLWMRNYRKNNREKMRDYNREYNKTYRKIYGYNNEEISKQRYPEKTKARKLLQNAVRIGMVVRQPCESCKATVAQGHHDDYSKPLEVKWLCALCHTQLHRG